MYRTVDILVVARRRFHNKCEIMSSPISAFTLSPFFPIIYSAAKGSKLSKRARVQFLRPASDLSVLLQSGSRVFCYSEIV